VAMERSLLRLASELEWFGSFDLRREVAKLITRPQAECLWPGLIPRSPPLCNGSL